MPLPLSGSSKKPDTNVEWRNIAHASKHSPQRKELRRVFAGIFTAEALRRKEWNGNLL